MRRSTVAGPRAGVQPYGRLPRRGLHSGTEEVELPSVLHRPPGVGELAIDEHPSALLGSQPHLVPTAGVHRGSVEPIVAAATSSNGS